MKELLIALIISILFAVLGSIAEYKYDLIHNWVEIEGNHE